MAIVSKGDRRGSGAAVVFVGWFVAALLLGLTFVIWSLYAEVPENRNVLPTPGDALRTFGGLFGDAAHWAATWATLANWVVGFAIAGAVGSILGALAGRHRGFAMAASPAAYLFGAFPVVFLAPMCIMFDGIDSSTGAIFSAALLAVFPVAGLVAQGQRAEDGTDRARSLFRALEIGAILALAGVLFVEMIAGKDRLGAAILNAFSNFEARKMFALGLWIWALALAVTLPFALARWVAGRAARD